VGARIHLIAVGLASLGEQDQRRRIGRLQRKGEVEQDERIDVELRPARHIDPDPYADDDRLADEKGRRAEEAGEGFRPQPERVAAENRFEMGVRQMESPRPVLSRSPFPLAHASSVDGLRRGERRKPRRYKESCENRMSAAQSGLSARPLASTPASPPPGPRSPRRPTRTTCSL